MSNLSNLLGGSNIRNTQIVSLAVNLSANSEYLISISEVMDTSKAFLSTYSTNMDGGSDYYTLGRNGFGGCLFSDDDGAPHITCSFDGNSTLRLVSAGDANLSETSLVLSIVEYI